MSASHAGFPLPNPPPLAGEGDEGSLREFFVNVKQYACKGFTLIEMLVVVAVLSSVALLSFGMVADDRMQLRHDDTVLRMKILERAVLGRLTSSETGALAGYVADNGVLPGSLSELLATPTGLTGQAAIPPQFDPSPDASCADNGGATTISATPLFKGHRGSYLGGEAFNGRFRDGWGNIDPTATVDALNFGWVWTVASNALTLASLGADNASGGADYAADRARAIAATDWRVPLAALNVRLRDSSGSGLAADSYAASLLVFVNTGSGGVWRRYSSSANPVIAANATATLTFAGLCTPGGAAVADPSVPQGRHLLALTQKNAGWNSAETLVANRFAYIDLRAGQSPETVEFTAP